MIAQLRLSRQSFWHRKCGKTLFSTKPIGEGSEKWNRLWQEVFPEDILRKKVFRKFEPAKDPSFIIENPQKRLVFPYLGMDYLNKAIEQISSSFERDEKVLFALVKGFGSGKTRFLEELKYEFEKKENTLPITISFSGRSSYNRTTELFYPTDPNLTFCLATISRLASAFYLIEHDEIVKSLQGLRNHINNTASFDSASLLESFLSHILEQQKGALRPSSSSSIPSLQFLFLVDEVMQLQNLFPQFTHPISASLQRVFAQSSISGVPARLVLSSDHPQAIFPLSSTSPVAQSLQIRPLSIPESLDIKEVFDHWLFAPHEEFPNLSNAAKNLSTFQLIKFELLMNYFTNHPRTIQNIQDHLEESAKRDSKLDLHRSVEDWFLLNTLGVDLKTRPAEYRLGRKFPAQDRELLLAMILQDRKILLTPSSSTSVEAMVRLELFRRNFFENVLQQEDIVTLTNDNTSGINVPSANYQISILPKVSPLCLEQSTRYTPDASPNENKALIERLLDLFQFKIPSLVEEATEMDSTTFRGKCLAGIGSLWLEIKLLTGSPPNLIPEEELLRREQIQASSYISAPSTSSSNQSPTIPKTEKITYTLTPSQLSVIHRESLSLAKIFHLDDRQQVLSSSRISRDILDQLQQLKIFLPSYTWLRTIPKTFSTTLQPFGKKQFIQLLNEQEVSAEEYSIQFLSPKIPTEKEAFDIVVLMYDAEHPDRPFLLFCNFQHPHDNLLLQKKLPQAQHLEGMRQDPQLQKLASSAIAKSFFAGNYLFFHFTLLETSSYSQGKAVVFNRDATEKFFGMTFPFFQSMRRVHKEKLMV